jgi:hypothetical protein
MGSQPQPLAAAVPNLLHRAGVDLIDYYDEIGRKTGLCNFPRKIPKELKVRSLPDFDPRVGQRKKRFIWYPAV